MKVTPTAIPDVLIIEPKVFGDERGFFFESFNQKAFNEATGLDVNFVQGRKTATLNIEIRYKSALSIVPGYTWFSGGADGANLYKDRDFAQIYVKYQF